ncbi:9958_t:CDS:2, partial [Acaulospora morrowiae]
QNQISIQKRKWRTGRNQKAIEQSRRENQEHGRQNQHLLEVQMQYQDAEEINIEKNEIPLATYKAINDEVAERQDKLEKQIEQMGRMLTELLEN